MFRVRRCKINLFIICMLNMSLIFYMGQRYERSKSNQHRKEWNPSLLGSNIQTPASYKDISASNMKTSASKVQSESNKEHAIQMPGVLRENTMSDTFINIMPWHKRWYGDRVPHWYEEGLGTKVFAECPEPRCRLVKSLKPSDAVLIAHKFLADYDAEYLKKFKLPPFRHPRQKWIFVSNEPPQYTPVAPKYLHLFNGTFTYRADSDAHYPYGHVIERPSPLLTNAANKESDRLKHDPHWDKKKDVVWIVSNCHAKSKRELYVKELSKYINITVFGDCGKRIECRRTESNYYNLACYQNIENHYKFYLAFENSLCKEYGSEKFWRTLQQNMIPVVYGLYDYKQNAPNNSYIDVRDFESPQKLAEYLKRVSSDRRLYETYMDWKKTKAVKTNPFRKATCQLCEHLHKSKNDPHKTVDLSTFWGAETNCIPPDPFLESLGVTVR